MRVIAESGPAVHRRAVVFCLNPAWLPFGAFAARQIALLPGSRSFDICIASTEQLDLPEGLKDLGLRVLQIEIGAMLSQQDTATRHGDAGYLRLAMPDLLKADYDRILYLDSDIFVHGGDFNKLFEVDLGGLCLGAVRVVTQWGSPERQRHEFAALDLAPAPYFNSGVLLIDVPAYIAAEVTRKALDLGAEKGHLFRSHDQSLLNVCLYRAWAELSPVWNWQWYVKAPFFAELAGQNIVHMIGPVKPWHDPGRACISLLYRKAYDSFLAAYFPDVQRVPQYAPDRMRKGWWWFLVGLRHVLRRRRFLRYLDRFPTETTVHLP